MLSDQFSMVIYQLHLNLLVLTLKPDEFLLIPLQEAVEKYDEVVHNLEFAKELQKTFSGLSQDVSLKCSFLYCKKVTAKLVLLF